ncbi:MAG: hypothetical protein QOK10_231 [Pseudonocardiales bacterium]|jgi:hypothetical protein|nr:hypothetical protein [Pseudonocardiales bacterium]
MPGSSRITRTVGEASVTALKATLVSVTDEPQRTPAQPGYRERLYTPWWWYLGGVGVAALLGAEFALAIPRWWAWILFAGLILMCVAVVWRLSSGRVLSTGTTLTAGDRTIALGVVESAIGLTPGELRRLVGRHSNPLAFTFVRSWVGPGVQLVLRDNADTEPYWVVSTRHPDRLLAALAAAAVPVR